MAAKKTGNTKAKPKKRTTTRKTARGGSVWWTLLTFSLLIGSAALALYVYYLDIELRKSFSGHHWQVPAKVYASPLELYPGHPLNEKDLEGELQKLGYQSRATLDGPGTYHPEKQRIELYTRLFRFWDGEEPARKMALLFEGGHIQKIQSIDTSTEQPVLRLDPRLIGGIYPSQQEDRLLLKFDELPKSFVNGLLAVEDREFWNHYGVRPISILRAMVENIKAGAMVQGGSTITQQLVKNFFLTSERSLRRKFNEAIMALLMEYHYSKRDILEA